jgi:hypothetical protein
MATIIEGLYDHEGWLALVLDDGTETNEWSTRIEPRIVGVRPSCECGWRGTLANHPAGFPEDNEYDEYMQEWERQHARPVLALRNLRDAGQEARRAGGALREAVAEARAAGASWSEVGTALSVTKQAAQQRFG